MNMAWTRRAINFFIGVAFYWFDKYLQSADLIPSQGTLKVMADASLLINAIVLYVCFSFDDEHTHKLFNIILEQSFPILIGIYVFCC
jgi:hypothetical protein